MSKILRGESFMGKIFKVKFYGLNFKGSRSV